MNMAAYLTLSRKLWLQSGTVANNILQYECSFLSRHGRWRCSCAYSEHGGRNKTESVESDSHSHRLKKQGVADLFIRDDVQTILKRITGLDLQKVFPPLKEKLKAPTYRFMSDSRLKEHEESARQGAVGRLQMPPVLEEREKIREVLSQNPELEGLDSSKFVFTDIAYGISDRERFIVVREPGGRLRKAFWEERDRMIQINFPRARCDIVPAPLFNDINLKLLFSQDRHLDLLDATCAQFEPDSSDFIRIHHKTYEDIETKEKYALLRSTRYFGGLAFHLTRKQQIDGMIADMVQRNLMSDAADLIHLYHLLHPECPSSIEVHSKKLNGVSVLKIFIEMDARQKGRLQLVLQAYMNERANNETTGKHKLSL